MKPEIGYEVWSERDGKKLRRNLFSTSHPAPMQDAARQMNADEEARAERERRPVQVRYFVVKVTSTFKEVK